mmetsp:Transcript_2653/g.11032  ORF Transcript_2653/g.11032 Transcript_2653/m.11032 type:complete len:248 (+) Transcript_2653:590-1333(+)
MVATIEEDLEGFRDAVEQHDLSVLVLVAQPPSPHLRADADPEVLTLPVLVLVDQGLARIGEQGHEVLRGHFLLRLVGEGDDVAPVKIRRLTGVRALPNDAADDKLGWTRELHHVMPDGDQRFPVDGEALREGEGAVVGRHQDSRLPLEETLEVLVVEGIRSGWFRTGRVPPTNHFPTGHAGHAKVIRANELTGAGIVARHRRLRLQGVVAMGRPLPHGEVRVDGHRIAIRAHLEVKDADGLRRSRTA